MKRFVGLFVVLMVLAACAQLAPEAPLEPSQAESSAPFVIDFNNLRTGQLIWKVTPGRGMTGTATDIGKVKIVARRDNNKGRRLNGNRAMVFDAACKGSRNGCTGNTSSLYHPEQGKVAIISENNNSVTPKPNKWGGIIDFKFDQFAQGRADLKSIKVFGVERRGAHIDLYRDRQRVARIPIPITGASGSATVTLDTANIGLMRVRLVGSGAVDDVMLGTRDDDGGDGGDGGTTLPPDPGEAGKVTLAGIDSD